MQGAARLAQALQDNRIYRTLTRDCGQLLGSTSRMAAIGSVGVPTTSIAGVGGPRWKTGPWSKFGGEPNDGVVALSEVSAGWIADQVVLGTIHTLLPMSPRAAAIILARLADAAPLRVRRDEHLDVQVHSERVWERDLARRSGCGKGHLEIR